MLRRSGRSVPISSQLRSHRLFAENWERLAYLVDAATLYHTGKQLPLSLHMWHLSLSNQPVISLLSSPCYTCQNANQEPQILLQNLQQDDWM